MSIALNIAEGYSKRDSDAEFKRYLRMAIGSANEVAVLLDFARDLRYIQLPEHEKLHIAYDEIGRMVNGLIQSLG